MIAAFTFVYIFVPNTRVRLGPAIVGAMVAGVLWQSIGWGFASFVVNSTKYAAIYSGFAILILFMIWLYLAWLILLVGASIAFYHQHPEYLSLQRAQNLCPGNREREWIGLLAICQIARHHFEGLPPPTVEQLSNHIGSPPGPVEDALKLLQSRNLVVTMNAVPERYLPGIAPERLSIQAVLSALRSADDQPDKLAHQPALERTVAGVFSAVEQATQQTLQGLTVRDLVLGETPLGKADTGNDSSHPREATDSSIDPSTPSANKETHQ